MTKISKGKLFSVTTAVDAARLRQMRRAPDLAAAAMRAGAEYWHDHVLPRHFQSGAHAKYGYALRAMNYLKNRRKTGKPDLVFSGTLRHDLAAAAAYRQAAQGSVELRLAARVLNLAPTMPQHSGDLYVRHKNGRGYPNLKREIKAITDAEREAVAEVVKAELERSMAPGT